MKLCEFYCMKMYESPLGKSGIDGYNCSFGYFCNNTGELCVGSKKRFFFDCFGHKLDKELVGRCPIKETYKEFIDRNPELSKEQTKLIPSLSLK